MNPRLVNTLIVLAALAVAIGSQWAGGLASQFQIAAAFLLGLGTKRFGDAPVESLPSSPKGDGY